MEDLLQHIAFEADLRKCFSESDAQLEGADDRTWSVAALSRFTVPLLPGPQQEALAEREAAIALKDEGFGVITAIDVQATLKGELGVESHPYTTVGARNLQLAPRSLWGEPVIGR